MEKVSSGLELKRKVVNHILLLFSVVKLRIGNWITFFNLRRIDEMFQSV